MVKKKKAVQIKVEKNKEILKHNMVFEMKLTYFFAIVTFFVGLILIFYGDVLVYFFNNLTKIQKRGFFLIYITILAAHSVDFGRTFQHRKLHQKIFQRITILSMFLLFPIIEYTTKYPFISEKRVFETISIDHILIFGIGISIFYTIFRIIVFILDKVKSIIIATEGKPTDRITITIAIFGTIISIIALFK